MRDTFNQTGVVAPSPHRQQQAGLDRVLLRHLRTRGQSMARESVSSDSKRRGYYSRKNRTGEQFGLMQQTIRLTQPRLPLTKPIRSPRVSRLCQCQRPRRCPRSPAGQAAPTSPRPSAPQSQPHRPLAAPAESTIASIAPFNTAGSSSHAATIRANSASCSRPRSDSAPS